MANTFDLAAVASAADTPHSIHRASLRMSRAAWHLPLPSGAKLVLLSILSHYNDARGIAYPSITRLADVCGLHRRTVQMHLTRLVGLGVLWITRVPGLRNNGYRVDEVAISALQGGDLSAQGAENTTQNGWNAFERMREAAPAPSPATPPPAAAPQAESEPKPKPAAQPQPAPTPFVWAQHLHSDDDHAALQAWQAVRRAKGHPAQPSAAQCQRLWEHAGSVGQTLGWVLQLMVLNDWASFDPAWLNNQRPPPRLPDTAISAPSAPAARHPPATPRPVCAAAPPSSAMRAHIHTLLTRWRAEDHQK